MTGFYYRNVKHLELTLHDILELQLKLQLADNPTCPQDVPLPEWLARNHSSSSAGKIGAGLEVKMMVRTNPQTWKTHA